jgi:hypothetical protein
MNRFLGIIVLLLVVILPISACKSLFFWEPPQEGYQVVVTTESQLTQDVPQDQIGYVPLEIVPDEVEMALQVTPENEVIITARKNVKEESTLYVPLEGVNLREKEGWEDFFTDPGVLGVIKTLLVGVEGAAPWLLGIEAILAMFSARKRQHYGQAAKSLIKLQPKEALIAATKALGAMHTDNKKIESTEASVSC